MMKNPRIAAVLCALVILISLWRLFGAAEAPSGGLAFMNWLFLILALVGLIGAIRAMTRGE